MPDRRHTDVWLDRIVLATLGGVVLLGGAGLTVLSLCDKPVPPALTLLIGSASGILVGWFGREKVYRNGHGGTPPLGGDPPSWYPEETWPRREDRR